MFEKIDTPVQEGSQNSWGFCHVEHVQGSS